MSIVKSFLLTKRGALFWLAESLRGGGGGIPIYPHGLRVRSYCLYRMRNEKNRPFPNALYFAYKCPLTNETRSGYPYTREQAKAIVGPLKLLYRDTKYFFSETSPVLRFKAPVSDFAYFKVSPYRKETKNAYRGIIRGCGGRQTIRDE